MYCLFLHVQHFLHMCLDAILTHMLLEQNLFLEKAPCLLKKGAFAPTDRIACLDKSSLASLNHIFND